MIVLGDYVGENTGDVGYRLWLGMDCCGTMLERTYELGSVGVVGIVSEWLDVVV